MTTHYDGGHNHQARQAANLKPLILQTVQDHGPITPLDALTRLKQDHRVARNFPRNIAIKAADQLVADGTAKRPAGNPTNPLAPLTAC